MGTCRNESLAGFVGLEFLEVVDEHLGEFLSLVIPFFGICIGVAGIEDAGVYAGKLGRNNEIEVGKNLCGCLLDVTVEDVVDDTACVRN